MQDHSKAFSVRKAFSDSPRAVEDYHLCGVYHKAGLPFTVTEINGLDRPELEPFQSIPLQLAEECEKAVAAGKKDWNRSRLSPLGIKEKESPSASMRAS